MGCSLAASTCQSEYLSCQPRFGCNAKAADYSCHFARLQIIHVMLQGCRLLMLCCLGCRDDLGKRASACPTYFLNTHHREVCRDTLPDHLQPALCAGHQGEWQLNNCPIKFGCTINLYSQLQPVIQECCTCTTCLFNLICICSGCGRTDGDLSALDVL